MLSRLTTILNRPRLADADGVPRRLVQQRASGDDAAIFEAVRSRVPQPRFTTDGGRAISVALNLATAAVLVALLMYLGGRLAVWIGLAVIVSAALGLLVDFRLHPRTIYAATDSQALRDAWLAEGHCPSCAYPLNAHPARPAHLHCPECGATWATPAPPRVPSA